MKKEVIKKYIFNIQMLMTFTSLCGLICLLFAGVLSFMNQAIAPTWIWAGVTLLVGRAAVNKFPVVSNGSEAGFSKKIGVKNDK